MNSFVANNLGHMYSLLLQ